MALAQRMKKSFIIVRKVGKLPAATIQEEYSLEYGYFQQSHYSFTGTAKIEIHKDALSAGQKVLIHDDLLATGGTAQAAANLVKKLDASVAAYLFIIELSFLKGKEKLEQVAPVISMIEY